MMPAKSAVNSPRPVRGSTTRRDSPCRMPAAESSLATTSGAVGKAELVWSRTTLLATVLRTSGGSAADGSLSTDRKKNSRPSGAAEEQ